MVFVPISTNHAAAEFLFGGSLRVRVLPEARPNMALAFVRNRQGKCRALEGPIKVSSYMTFGESIVKGVKIPEAGGRAPESGWRLNL